MENAVFSIQLSYKKILYFLYLVNPNYLLTVYFIGLHISYFNSHSTTTAILNDMKSVNIFYHLIEILDGIMCASSTNS